MRSIALLNYIIKCLDLCIHSYIKKHCSISNSNAMSAYKKLHNSRSRFFFFFFFFTLDASDVLCLVY